MHVVYTWSGKTFKLDIAESDRSVGFYHCSKGSRQSHAYDFSRVFDLKTALQEQTNVPPERQKILGLVKGKLPDDEVTMYVRLVL